MMRTQKMLVAAVLLTAGIEVSGQTAPDAASGQLVINELMQSNIDCTMDDLNEFPDSWVELYNSGTTAANTGDYKIGITPQAEEAYQLPSETIAPGGHRLVYCDKVGDKFHTDFRLESGKGCDIYLFKGGQIVDKLTDLSKQPAPNIAYGRETDGSSQWGYQLAPSPNAANTGDVCTKDQILGEPIFSEPGCVMKNGTSITLTLSLPEGSPEGTQIRYTIDGREPSSGSALYTAPITINTTCSVRARLICEGWLSPRSTTHSYIFFPRKLTLPVVAIATDNDYLNGRRNGIFANNTNEKRNNWRRPINFEYFDAEGKPACLNQLCETRVAGAASRGAELKSMALYAHKRFGTKRFEYEFFYDQKPGLTDFKSIVLRNAGNDFHYLYMRDAICQRVMSKHTDLDWQAWRPAIIYINGQYYGILNIRERGNENNVYTNYNGQEDIDLIENWGDLKEGTWDHYNDFKAFYTEKGHTMAEYEEWMDCQEFINLMVMNLYFNNYDFPGNNIIMWRPRAEGGRWRWIAKDVDYTMGLYDEPYNYKILDWLHNPKYDGGKNWGANSSESTLLFRRLMDDKDFRRIFIDHCAIYMGDFLNLENIRRVWTPMYNEIRTEYPHHRKLINQWWPNYTNEMNKASKWLDSRTDYFYDHLGDYYQLGSPIRLTVNIGIASDVLTSLTMNDIPLSRCQFVGKFYADRDLRLKATAPEGQIVSGWRVETFSSSGINTQNYEGDSLSLLMPNCSQMNIEPLLTSADGIREITNTAERPDAVYDLNGRMVRSGTTSLEGLPHGIYIVGGKKKVW